MDIELRHIHKRFGPVHANNDINLLFKGGYIVGVLGENGAGKSTLMKILSGFQAPDEGEIILGGRLAAYHGPQAAIRHGIGMLQQDPLDVPAFTVIENFIYGQRGFLLLRRKVAEKRLEALTARFGFELEPDTPISQLSIAQRQQLEIVRLLELGVKALILDEPTTGISAEQKDLLFEALRELAVRDGMTVLLVSHKLEDVIALCDEVVVLRGGKVVGAAQMPTTTTQLVNLMFGHALDAQPRPSVTLGSPVLALESISIHNKRLRVDYHSTVIRAGEVVGMAGLDGSGQELVMRALVGLEKLHHGVVRVAGVNMTGRPYREFLHAGVAFGAAGRIEEGLIAGLTLTEHVALVTEFDALVNWNKARAHTEQQIKHYDVRGTADNQIEALSGGNQQRVLMALLPEKPLALVLEQPTRGLDVDSSRWIWEQLLARRESGTAIVFSSPDLDELVTYSDRIFVFYSGHINEVPDVSSITIDTLGHLIGGEFDILERRS